MTRFVIRTVGVTVFALFAAVACALVIAPLLPSEGVVSYTTLTNRRYFLDSDTNIEVYRIIDNTVLPVTYMSWSADYSRVMFNTLSANETNEFWFVELENGVFPSTPITPFAIHTPHSLYFALSPDGTQYAYVQNESIWIRSIETGAETFVHSTPQIGTIDWSPNNKTLAFESHAVADDIDLLNVETGIVSPLNEHLADKYAPSFSPNGHYLTYVAIEDYHYNIYVTNIETGVYRHITQEGINVQPHWSPDGEFIIFLRPIGSDGNVVAVVDVATGEIHQLTEPSSFNYPVWLP